MTALERAGQFEVRTWGEAYLRGGSFDKNAMLSLLEGVLQNGKSRGIPLTRLVAHMQWALEDRQGVDDLVELPRRWADPENAVAAPQSRRKRPAGFLAAARSA